MRYSYRPRGEEGAEETASIGGARESGASRPRPAASGTRPAPRAQSVLRLEVVWSAGGHGVDLVKLVVDGVFRRPRDLSIDAGRERLTIELEVDPMPRHRVELLTAFVGESRHGLTLAVWLDGTLVGTSAPTGHVMHRWEASWSGP